MALGTENQRQHSYKMLSTSIRSFQQQPPAHRAIAPAPVSRAYAAPYVKSTSVYAAGTTLDSNNPAVVRRNARERNRVKQVNNGFVHLRQHLPTAIVADLSNGRRGVGPGANKKLSKVDTLRMALEYIRRLQRVIEKVDSSSDASSVSSYNTCGSSSGSGSPTPDANNYYKPQYYSAVSYAGSFQPTQPQLQQHSSMLISPANSTSSSSYSTDSLYNSALPDNRQCPAAQLKYEQTFDDYGSTSADDEDILDYISLWQEDL